MDAGPPPPLDRKVAELLDDLAHHREAAAEISALGERAVDPLRRYLDGPPQSFPHARQLAVRMLGLIGGPAAIAALRALLTRHDLAALAPALAQSEYAVKDEAVVQLLRLERSELAEEYLAAFRRDRLPAAADALARLGVTAAIPDLVAALEDDVLAQRAADGLRRFGASAGAGLVRALGERHGASEPGGESRVSRQRRMTAALLLGELASPASATPLRVLLGDGNPNVAAAAAAALARCDPARLSKLQRRAIVFGGLSPEWRLRGRCQEVAQGIGADCAPAAAEALAAETVVDLYGVPAVVDRAQRRWLVALILEHASGATAGPEAALLPCDSELLAEGLAEVRAPEAATAVAALRRHPDPLARAAVARTLGRLAATPAAAALLGLADDPVRSVRAAAVRALRVMVATGPELAATVRSTVRSGGSWRLRAQLWWKLRRSAKVRRFPGTQR